MRRNRALQGFFALGLVALGLAVAGCDRCNSGCREYRAPVYSNGPAYGGGYYPVRYARRDDGNQRPFRNNWNNHRNRNGD